MHLTGRLRSNGVSQRLRNLAVVASTLRQSPEPEEHPAARAVRWLLHSQASAQSLFGQSGYSRRYSLLRGWDPAYPETSGYIIPTLLNAAGHFAEMRTDLVRSAAAAGEWMLSIQNADGSFNGIDDGRPQVFDTGQILFGLRALYVTSGQSRYMDAAQRAADWIASVQDANGAWSRFSCHSRPHTYYSRVSWALALVHEATGNERLRMAAVRNLEWVNAQQQPDGSFAHSGFVPHETVLHTIAYTMQGLVEAGVLLRMQECVAAADRTAAVIVRMWRQGKLRGYYRAGWNPAGRSLCLTGLAQLAVVLMRLHQVLGREDYPTAATELTSATAARQLRMPSAVDLDGAIPGSSPIWGRYCPLSFPNWAAKFFVDSHLLACEIRSGRGAAVHPG